MSLLRRTFDAAGAMAVCIAAFAGVAGAAPDAGAIKALNKHDQALVRRLKAKAAERLREPECRKLLTEFRDREGRTLHQNLEAWSLSAHEYLRRLPFQDGSHLGLCRRASVHMAATPGIPRVLVCPGVGSPNSRLGRVERASSSLAEAMVIHEMLHTLGLGENPPSTFEITERVRERCR
jgi:hypothetical protein